LIYFPIFVRILPCQNNFKCEIAIFSDKLESLLKPKGTSSMHTIFQDLTLKHLTQTFDEILNVSDNQLTPFNTLDELLQTINKKKYFLNNQILHTIKDTKMPRKLKDEDVTLLALLNYFEKNYVFKPFLIDAKRFRIPLLEQSTESATIESKINNFPHLIGIRGFRDETGNVISRIHPKTFLDGVLYQWILLSSTKGYEIDYQKIEVFPWIKQTLANPTYIFPAYAIRTEQTNFYADLTFVKRVIHSDTYAFHLVGLKQDKKGRLHFTSQFAISHERYHQLKKIFDIKKGIYYYEA